MWLSMAGSLPTWLASVGMATCLVDDGLLSCRNGSIVDWAVFGVSCVTVTWDCAVLGHQ